MICHGDVGSIRFEIFQSLAASILMSCNCCLNTDYATINADRRTQQQGTGRDSQRAGSAVNIQ